MYQLPYTFQKGLRIIQNNTCSLLSYVIRKNTGPLQFSVIKRGKGPYLYDYDDNRFVDFNLSGGSLLLGHSPPRITNCIKSWLSRGYGSGYPTITHELLSKTVFNTVTPHNRNQRYNDGKWFYYNSPFEASSALLSILHHTIGTNNGLYITGDCWKDESLCKPFTHADLEYTRIDRIDSRRLADTGYVILRFDKTIGRERAKDVMQDLKNREKLIIIDETDFESHVHIRSLIDETDCIDARVFGSWLSSGLSFGCIFAGNRLSGFLQKSIKSRDVESINSYMGFPPLFKIKTALRFLGILQKGGGISELLKRYQFFYSELGSGYFELINTLLFMKNTDRPKKKYQNLRFELLQNGFYFPFSLKIPLFLSFAHTDELLKKCAKNINLIFESFYR